MKLRSVVSAAVLFAGIAAFGADPVLIPQVDGDWWTVAGNPDLGKYTTAKQEPVDFAVWQAADGSWQLWSCIRHTLIPGGTRVFHRWQGASLTSRDWEPMGIAMRTDPAFGEEAGWPQAPFVFKVAGEYRMYYGGGSQICLAKSADGKTFARQLLPNGKSAVFTDGAGSGTRDVMVLKIGDLYHAYYTQHTNEKGIVNVRTSKDLGKWSGPKTVAAAGAAGDGPWSAECPFVHYHKPSGHYYMFRTQRYIHPPETRVYRSKDPLNFGVNDDRYLVATLPVAAPELMEHDGHLYMAALLPDLKGIRIAKLKWVAKP